MLQSIGETVWRYCRCAPDTPKSVRVTRGDMRYACTGEDSGGISTALVPVSVCLCDDHIVKLATGPPLSRATDEIDNFWLFLRSFGG